VRARKRGREREEWGWYVGGRNGRRGQQTATYALRSPFYIFAVSRPLVSRNDEHVDTVQPSTSRTIEVQFLVPLSLRRHARRQPHVANRIDDSFNDLSRLTFRIPRTRSVVRRRNPLAKPFRLPSFNIADACSVFRIAARTLV